MGWTHERLHPPKMPPPEPLAPGAGLLQRLVALAARIPLDLSRDESAALLQYLALLARWNTT